MKKRLCALFLICCMLLGITACGSDEDTIIGKVSLQSRLNEEQIYYASDLELGVESEVADVDFRAYGPSIYYPEGQTVETYFTADGKTTADTYTWADAPGEWVFERVCYNGAGELYGLVIVGASTAPYLCRFDIDKNLVFAKELEQFFQDVGNGYSAGSSRLEVGTDGRIYISSSDGLWIFEEDGSYKGEVSFGNVKDVSVLDFAGDAYRNLYVLYEDKESREQFVAEIDTEDAAVTAVQQTISLTGINATENGLLAFNGAIVYRYDREQRSLTELFRWSECGVNGSAVYGVYLLADGNIFVAGNVQGSIRNYLVKSLIIEKVEGSETGKTDIRIAVYNSRTSHLLSRAVSRFNKSSERYNIVLEDYAADGGDAARARLAGELAKGAGPDIIDLGIGNVESMVEDGYLEDLGLYLEESETLSEGDFLEMALEAYRINDVLAAIPQHFSMTVLVGNSDYVGDERGWTLEEMLDLLEQNVGQQVFAEDSTRELTRDYFFRYMLALNEDYFVDRAAGTCDFDNETFRRLAKLAEEYPITRTQAEEGEVKPSEYTNLQNENGILCFIGMYEFKNLQIYDAALNGNMTCIGFPDQEREGVVASYSDALGINSNSPNKEGAWEFLEYYLQLVGASTISHFPTYRPSIQFLADSSMEDYTAREMAYGSDGWRFMEHASTQEEIDTVYELIEAARPSNIEWALINILVEELEGYYAGEITLDSAIESIEKEVLLYLEESLHS